MPTTTTPKTAKPAETATTEPVVYPTLIAALAAFQKNLPSVRKNQTADVQGREGRRGYSYDYADLTDVSEAVLPALAEVGLAFHTGPDLVDGQVVLKWELAHAHSTDTRTGILPVGRAGSNWQDMGGAITYARRYALTAATGVAPGGDDNDAASNVAAGNRPTATQKPVDRPAAVDYLPEGLYNLGTIASKEDAEKMYYTARRAGHLNLMLQAEGVDMAFGDWLRRTGQALGPAAADPDAAQAAYEAEAIAAHEAEDAQAFVAGEQNG